MRTPIFLIRSQPRCGTHMLKSMLNQHPQLDCLGEVFNEQSILGRRIGIRGHWPMERQVTHAWKRANGFCVHGYQHERRGGGTLMHVLAEHRPEVIWLSRQDRFLQAISHEIACERSYWSSDRSIQPQPFRVKLDRMVAYVRKEDAYARRDSKIFSACRVFTVTYEDLVSDRQHQVQHILGRLDVPYADLAPTTVRTRANDDLEQYVPNWKELQREFWKRVGRSRKR